jgi:hypothetical protein
VLKAAHPSLIQPVAFSVRHFSRTNELLKLHGLQKLTGDFRFFFIFFVHNKKIYIFWTVFLSNSPKRMTTRLEIRDQIVETASRIFSKYGFRKTTMDEIAA